jgi:hypothetical protein
MIRRPRKNARCASGWSANAKQCAPPVAPPAETNQLRLRAGGGNAKTSPSSGYISTATSFANSGTVSPANPTTNQ